MGNDIRALRFGHWAVAAISFDEALARLPEELKNEGFGIVTEIDFKAVLKAKLGVEFRRYRVFGACNPTAAHAALQEDPSVGVLLPCNVVLYEGEGGQAMIGAVDPTQTLGANSENRALVAIAADIQRRLQRVVAKLS